MEATGHYSRNLFGALADRSYAVALIDPLRTRRFAEEDLMRAKTDSVDPLAIPRFAAQKRPTPTRLDMALVRVDITFRATLPYGSTTPMPAPDGWVPWVASVEGKPHNTLTGRHRRKGANTLWRGGLEIDGRTTPDGAFSFHGMSVPAYEMIVVPRIWDDPRLGPRSREGTFVQMKSRDAAMGEGPLQGPRGGWARGWVK